MADDEQFSLCWNNFNSNLSAGFHESLCREDLVDVTLAAEGQFVKAHRLVLSVCSPYFRRMFIQMPANQHAFVFLKDVSHSALKDLIQFMYCGEVNVKQDALPAFISTAEALQIKGLTDNEPAPSQSPAKPSTPAPQTIVAATLTTGTTTTSPRTRISNQRNRYKIESEDSGDENKPTNQLVLQATQTQPTLVQQTQKRPAQRSITPHTAPTVKRIKSNIDPLEGSDATTTTTQITVQAVTDSKTATGEPEYIDLPIDLPTKSEPDYAEEAGDVETAEQEATYVEDDSYGDMKYDESYFTENEEATGTGATATTSGATVKQTASFSESYVSDTGDQNQSTDAQGKRTQPKEFHMSSFYTNTLNITKHDIEFYQTSPNTRYLIVKNNIFHKNSSSNNNTYWRCRYFRRMHCHARAVSKPNAVILTCPIHNHPPMHQEREIVAMKNAPQKQPPNIKLVLPKGMQVAAAPLSSAIKLPETKSFRRNPAPMNGVGGSSSGTDVGYTNSTVVDSKDNIKTDAIKVELEDAEETGDNVKAVNDKPDIKFKIKLGKKR